MSIFFYRGRVVTAVLISIGLLLTLGVSVASAHPTLPAHAKVLSAVPAIGSTISQAPTTVTVTTAENMKPGSQFSNLFVYGPQGDLISQGNATIPLTSPEQMSIPIKPTGDGIYVVRWITVSAGDGDPDQGAFVFTVKASTPNTTLPTTPTTPAASTPSSGTPIWVPILAGVLALLVGLGAGFGLGRRKPAPSTVASMRRNLASQLDPQEIPTKKS